MSCTLALALSVVSAPHSHEPIAAGVAWESSYEGALARSKEENKAVFIAVNMDDQKSNDDMADLYEQRDVVSMSASLVCMIASRGSHGSSTCKRFGHVDCGAHQSIESRVRTDLLKQTAAGNVIAPQHLFLLPDGKVFLSVPFALSEGELLWCMRAAIQEVDPGFTTKVGGLRAPRMLSMGEVFDPAKVGALGGLPLEKDEMEEVLEEIRAAMPRDRHLFFDRLLTTPHEKALAQVELELKSKWSTRNDNENLVDNLTSIGAVSPPEYWEVVAPYAKNSDPKVRKVAAVALEQLGEKKALKALKAAYAKEKEPSVKKNFLRALGTVGAEDKSTHKLLLKVAEKDKDELLRLNATLALGFLAEDEAVLAFLDEALAGEDVNLRAAAALAVACGRRTDRLAGVEAARDAEFGDQEKRLLAKCVAVLKGGKLSMIADEVSRIGGDELKRPRFF